MTFLFGFDRWLHELRLWTILDLIRGQDRSTIAIFHEESAFLLRVASMRAKVFCWRVIAASVNSTCRSRRRVDVNDIVLVLGLAFHSMVMGMTSFQNRRYFTHRETHLA
jgi:hypothetical protein